MKLKIVHLSALIATPIMEMKGATIVFGTVNKQTTIGGDDTSHQEVVSPKR